MITPSRVGKQHRSQWVSVGVLFHFCFSMVLFLCLWFCVSIAVLSPHSHMPLTNAPKDDSCVSRHSEAWMGGGWRGG